VTAGAPLLEIRNVSKFFSSPASITDWFARRHPPVLQAVRDVSLALQAGETLGIVGESGCGKSTLGRCVLGLYELDAGEVRYRGRSIAELGGRRARSRAIQMIFQDPFSSLNPRMTLSQTLDEALRVHDLRKTSGARRDRIDELLLTVGLAPRDKHRLPHSFSGGQRQRISIARALAVEPAVIVADEPVSALDASVQAQILNLFVELRERLGLSYIFIAHDLNVVRYVSRRIAVMYLGEIVEYADADAIFDAPRHPYTRALLSAIPHPDLDQRTETVSLEGDLPDPLSPPKGCSFSTRCPMVIARCRAERPPERIVDGHHVRCHRAEELRDPEMVKDDGDRDHLSSNLLR
jgi:oligopeptide/dipeptide ABC transporter ATP-binding protein